MQDFDQQHLDALLALLEGDGAGDRPLGGNLFELYNFGLQAEEFVRSNRVGAYLCAQAAEEVHTTVWDLLTGEHDNNALIRLVHKARAPHTVLCWLRDVIQSGASAEKLIDAETTLIDEDHLEETGHGEDETSAGE